MIHHSFLFFFFNDTATTEIYTLSLHDALPICRRRLEGAAACGTRRAQFQKGSSCGRCPPRARDPPPESNPQVRLRGASRQSRSEEHTSELQSQSNLVCRLLLEKKNKPDIHLSP